MQFKSFMEALKGNQHKIDKNKNNKIDAHDFKLLRKEEEELEEAKMSDADMAERERIVKGMKKNLAGFKARYGDKAKEVMYATATKQAMKEETLDEALDPSEIAGNPKMYDAATVKKAYYHKSATTDDKKSLERHLDRHHGNKEWRKTVKEETVEEAVQKVDVPAYLRKQKGEAPLKMSDLKRKDTISDKENLAKLRNEEAEELDEKSDQAKRNKMMKNMMDASRGARYKLNNPVPDAEPEHKTAQAHNKAIGRALRNEEKKDDVPFDGPYTKTKPAKNSDGTTQEPMSRARELAKQAMKKQMKEHFDIEMTDEQAESILEAIDEQAPVAPVPDKKYIKGTPEHKAYKATKKPINGMPTNVKETFDADGNIINNKVSYKEFAMMLEYEAKDGRYVHKGSYGGSYVDPEGADDADDKKTKQQPAEKRGRGRPAGAKSGAGKITGTSKLYK